MYQGEQANDQIKPIRKNIAHNVVGGLGVNLEVNTGEPSFELRN
jgi:hypothetical protein